MVAFGRKAGIRATAKPSDIPQLAHDRAILVPRRRIAFCQIKQDRHGNGLITNGSIHFTEIYDPISSLRISVRVESRRRFGPSEYTNVVRTLFRDAQRSRIQ